MTDTQQSTDGIGVPADVGARMAMIEARIAQPMTEEQAEEVRARIARSIALGAALRGYRLGNADEPEIDFDPLGALR